MGGAAPRFFFLLSTPFPVLRHRRHQLLLLSPSFSHFRRLASSSFPSHPRSTPLRASQHQHHQDLHNQAASSLRTDSWSSPPPHHSHPWPEWSRFLSHISFAGYAEQPMAFDAGTISGDDDFVTAGDLTELFLRDARACLAFARDRPNLLRLLSMRDIALVVEHGSPFLFRNAEDSVSKMKSFISNTDTTVLSTDRANMVDLMKYMLTYASNTLVSSEGNNLYNRDLLESSVRNLFGELYKLSNSAPGSNFSDSVQNQMPGRFGQTMPPGQKIEMKRGDWICPRCNFMNFARNIKCLECEEARPKRQLAGGEWECPQCDFYNYGRNATCLRCDCKRPGQISLGASNTMSGIGYGNGGNTNTSDVESRLAANEEKAQRWFSKVSQLDSSADINSVIADEDFPEIMPLRKGVNRFVVSTRKTPLERRLADAQYRRNLGNNGTPGVEDFRTWEVTKSPDTRDDILGRSVGLTQSDSKNIVSEHNTSTDSLPSISSNSSYYKDVKGTNSSLVPPVPSPDDMFPRKSENLITEESEKVVLDTDVGYASSGDISQLSNKSTTQNVGKDKEKEQAEKSERWFRKVTELHNVSDLTSTISDEDFPEIMPMRKGENRFVVSKKKDRSLTSPAYKRRLAMEQAGHTNFVPFVPFPPDYFAKKDKQQTDGTNSTDRSNIESSALTEVAEKPPETLDDARARHGFTSADYGQGVTNVETLSGVPGNLPEMLDDARSGWQTRDHVQGIENQDVNMKSWSEKPYGQSSSNSNIGPIYRETTNRNSSQSCVGSQIDDQEGSTSKYSWNDNKDHMPNVTASSSPASENQNAGKQWTGKSLEGSAVREPDPLDMSEEAKAERWFRRVAQIKDISELSQIPDEDFPSIMPMRKGVNRFVVSKRKTPLERRLTSQQYRKNLPIVSSDPIKKENGGS